MLNKQKIKYIQSLGQKKFRQAEGVFIAEGPKLVGELLEDKRTKVIEVFATGEWFTENGLIPGEEKFHLVRSVELDRISQLTTPNRVLAIVEQHEEADEIELRDQLTLVLDSIQDPGNFGTIIRIADWFGVEQIVASNDSADRYNHKVVQATMGSIARVKVYYRELSEWLRSVNKGMVRPGRSDQDGMVRPSRSDHSEHLDIYAATLGGKDISNFKKIDKGIIIIGNESKGVSQEIISLADHQITISKKGKAESLNAAVATGIILSHLI